MSYTPYQPYDWETGEVITEGKLDHIEEGLEAASEQIAENESDIAELNEQMPTKASIDQSYSDLGSGYTTTLKPTKYNQNQEPYLFRKALGARLTSEKIVGGTVAWNQLVQNGDFASVSTWTVGTNVTYTVSGNVATINPAALNRGISQSLPKLTGHVCIVSIDLKPSDAGQTIQAYLFNGSTYYTLPVSGTTAWTKATKIVKPSGSNDTTAFAIQQSEGTIADFQARNAFVVDLTLAFGTTIADHIYALEQAQAGAGVAFLRNNGFMTKDYYAYNAGSLESVLTSGHRTVGFNQWDEQWEFYVNYIKSKNFIPILPNANYYLRQTTTSFPILITYYDADKNYLAGGDWSDSQYHWYNNYVKTMPINAYFMKFAIHSQYGTTYNHDICINLSSDRNGEYEPYEEHEYPLSPVSLRGIMTLVDGKLQNDGDEYYPDGTHKERFTLINLGERDWTQAATAVSGKYRFYTRVADIKSSDMTNGERSKCIYTLLQSGGTNSANSDGYTITENGDVYFYLSNYAESTPEAFKTAMSGVMLVAERTTPVISQLDPYQSEQTCSEYGTEQFIDERDVPIPVGHVTKYWPDLVAKIEGLPDVTAIAPTENNATASQAYTTGQYFIRNNEFCKAKTNIASGATFTLNTNYEVTTIAAELYAALNS